MISESRTAPPAAWTAFRWVLLSQLGGRDGSIFTSPSPNKSFQKKQTFERGASLGHAPRHEFVLGDLILGLTDAKLEIDLIPL